MAKTATAPRRSPLTPELRERFNDLLETWRLRELREHVTIPAKGRYIETGQLAGQMRRAPVEMEKDYGDGRYDDRKRLLHVVLDRLERRAPVDFDRVFDVLVDARRQTARALLERRKILQDREGRLVPWSHLVGRALRALERLRVGRVMTSLDGDWLEDAIARLRAEKTAAEGFAGRFAGGRPKDSAVEEARGALEAAGVPAGTPGFYQTLDRAGCDLRPRGLRNALLMAAGLVPPRP
jgi:hypothetical protein